MAIGFTPDALPDATLTIYPGLGPVLFNTNLCSLVARRDREYVGRKMLEMELPGKRQKGQPKRRYTDAVREHMRVVGVRVEDTEEDTNSDSLWQRLKKDKPKGEEESVFKKVQKALLSSSSPFDFSLFRAFHSKSLFSILTYSLYLYVLLHCIHKSPLRPTSWPPTW